MPGDGHDASKVAVQVVANGLTGSGLRESGARPEQTGGRIIARTKDIGEDLARVPKEREQRPDHAYDINKSFALCATHNNINRF